MRRIDLYKDQTSIHSLYGGAEMPLHICHSSEELHDLTMNDPIQPTVFNNITQFATWIKDKGYTEQIKNYFVQKENIWLATNEIYKPDYQTDANIIIYQIKEDGSGTPIPTDNCYVQLIGFIGVNNKLYVATSSGIYNLSIFQWVTAAVKNQFRTDSATKRGKGSNLSREEKLMRSKRPTASDVKFVHYLLHTESEISDVIKAGKDAYGVVTPKKTIIKLLNSPKIRNLFLEEARKVIPNFQDVLTKVYPAEDLAGDMKTMVKKTLEVKPENFNQEAAQKALEFVMKQLDAPEVISPMQSEPLTAGKQPNMIQAGGVKITSFDATLNKASENTYEAEKVEKISSEQIIEAEKELAVPRDGYVASDTPTKEMNIKSLYGE